ncbi:uncharacterized coiled-coil DUF342 family protein [Methanomicrobium sp. W14]|uniref:hypothetical protein n=1 Tax=Methanomicrobium sp. W14 TaxID=2817839 RepID=UPI001AE7BE2B|nr:hypothetical protein [Methanomicrobium sp. W14]MBP2133975.1 uncharacterized coiled-coil DUF342 family protein [Methanomicrobium sp. W14]
MSKKTIIEINEKITNLREQLAGSLMSAEKEYRIRFEISDLQYESLQMQINDLHQKLESNQNKILKPPRNENNKSINCKRAIKDFYKQIEHLEMEQQTRVMNADKERELIEKIKELRLKIQEQEDNLKSIS